MNKIEIYVSILNKRKNILKNLKISKDEIILNLRNKRALLSTFS